MSKHRCVKYTTMGITGSHQVYQPSLHMQGKLGGTQRQQCRTRNLYETDPGRVTDGDIYTQLLETEGLQCRPRPRPGINRPLWVHIAHNGTLGCPGFLFSSSAPWIVHEHQGFQRSRNVRHRSIRTCQPVYRTSHCRVDARRRPEIGTAAVNSQQSLPHAVRPAGPRHRHQCFLLYGRGCPCGEQQCPSQVIPLIVR